MSQRLLRNRDGWMHSYQLIMGKMMHLGILVIVMLQQLQTTDAAKYKGDSCLSKNQPGVCKEWGECPVIKTLIERGEYTNREVVSCGFGIKEELICCPAIRTDSKIETTTIDNKDRFTESRATTQTPVRDFWLDLIDNITSSTTAAPDFWLDLLKPTTTTTQKPLIVGKQILNESSEFFDFNALLGGNQGNDELKQKNPSRSAQGIRPNDKSQFATANDSGHGNLNIRPVSINQWSFDQTGNSFNFGRDHNGQFYSHENGNGNFGWGQSLSNRGHTMGRGPHNNNGRGPENNGRVRNSIAAGNTHLDFPFSGNSIRPNNFFGDAIIPSHRPGRPVNNMHEQKPSTPFANNPYSNSDKQINNNEDKKIDDLIKNVFATSGTAQGNKEPLAVINLDKLPEKNLDDSIANIFNVNKPHYSSISPVNPSGPQLHNPQPVVWLTTQDNSNKNEVEFVEFHQTPGNMEIIPAVEHHMGSNDLDVAPSTSFIQQPVVVETWSSHPVHRPDFNPVQIVFENVANTGMDIVKERDYPVEHILNQQQQQQDGQQPTQIVVIPSQQQKQQFQQFVQQPKSIYQEPLTPQNNFVHQIFPQPVPQSFQTESSGKEPRSTSPLQQFVQQTKSSSTLNVQSPPFQILDPFKPFEFRPPPEDENTFFDNNNLLSTNSSTIKPNTKTNTDRPAVRACRRIEKGLIPSLTPHILGGTPAELGEFPHMAAIGYSRIGGDDRSPYDIRCGGTLIDKRFVLTAAHCVSERENVPSIVRLGVVNFTDSNQMKDAIELRIKETYIHDEYLTRLTYNDIAILELERDVEFSEYIYPVCLYTNEQDPDTKIKLWVTGWGTVNTTTRSFSDILLKAPLHTSPLKNCNKSFTDYGLNRRIPEGIIRSQFCAEDKDQNKDACQGDSGGPLNMIVDETYNNYRLVGVVSSGFGCASSTPGLYTRVAAFLDFIEKIVWPNGGD